MAMPGGDVRLRVQGQSKFRHWELTVIALPSRLRRSLRRDKQSLPSKEESEGRCECVISPSSHRLLNFSTLLIFLSVAAHYSLQLLH